MNEKDFQSVVHTVDSLSGILDRGFDNLPGNMGVRITKTLRSFAFDINGVSVRIDFLNLDNDSTTNEEISKQTKKRK